jgi:hypothetical protein
MESKLVGRIYKLVAEGIEKVYIGSTTQTLKDRLYGHRNEFRRGMRKGPSCLFEIAGIEGVRIEILEVVKVDSVCEIHEVERMYYDQYKAINMCTNKRRPHCTQEEVAGKYQANKEALKARSLARYYENQDAIKAQNLARYYRNKAKRQAQQAH